MNRLVIVPHILDIWAGGCKFSKQGDLFVQKEYEDSIVIPQEENSDELADGVYFFAEGANFYQRLGGAGILTRICFFHSTNN